jgi:hypothetical protein
MDQISLVNHFPPPNTSSDNDLKQPAKKKRRTSKKPGCKAYFDVQILDYLNNILNEDCNLHYHLDNKRNSKLPKQYAAPIIKNIKTSPVASTSDKAAKMQTSTNVTTIDDKSTKLGTTNDLLDGPNITHYASTNDIYKYLGSTGDNDKEELPINTAMQHNIKDTAHTKIDITTQPNDLETPQKLPFHHF